MQVNSSSSSQKSKNKLLNGLISWISVLCSAIITFSYQFILICSLEGAFDPVEDFYKHASLIVIWIIYLTLPLLCAVVTLIYSYKYPEQRKNIFIFIISACLSFVICMGVYAILYEFTNVLFAPDADFMFSLLAFVFIIFISCLVTYLIKRNLNNKLKQGENNTLTN
jgi:hypothetical protein